MRKAAGKEAKLCFAGHGLMDNRHDLMTDVVLTAAVGVTEPQARKTFRRGRRVGRRDRLAKSASPSVA